MGRPKGPERVGLSIRLLETTVERLKPVAEAAGYKTVTAYMTDYFDTGKDQAVMVPVVQHPPEPAQPAISTVGHRVATFPRVGRSNDVTPRFKKAK